MPDLNVQSNPAVAEVFANYPGFVKPQMNRLRQLILETAGDIKELSAIEETLKWGEPSYLAKKGSTIRIDWKPKKPDQYAIYFKCTSRLVETFKLVHGDIFSYEGHRAIVFQLNEVVPEAALKSCITAGLTYHRVKHLPLLGM